MLNNNDLDEGPSTDFKGATLQIDLATTTDEVLANPFVENDDITVTSSNCNSKLTTHPSLPYNYSKALTLYNQGSSDLVPWWSDIIDDYFSFRAGLIEQAVEDCRKLVISDEDGNYVGAWLLTEISSWDIEKERLVILSSDCLITVKYDFIALKLLNHDKVQLKNIDTVVIGRLIYPDKSLIPRLNGLVSGVSGVVRGCILHPLHKRLVPSHQQGAHFNENNSFQLNNFGPRSRNINGVRTIWNNGKELPFVKKWNPFIKMPWTTYTSHPLFWCKGAYINEKRQKMFSVDNFTENLIQAMEKINQKYSTPCSVEHRPILLENYINLPSIIHNKNALGFFKVRGKFSF